MALLTQQANTPKSASCVRLSCRTLARSRSEAFWANLGADGAAVGWAVQRPTPTDRQTDGHTPGRAPYQAVSWLLSLPSHRPSLVQAGTGSQRSAAAQRTVQFSATWLPSASSSVSLVAGTRISGITPQRSGGTAGRGFQMGKLIQFPAGRATVAAIPASLEKQALPRGSGSERCLRLFCNRLSWFSDWDGPSPALRGKAGAASRTPCRACQRGVLPS